MLRVSMTDLHRRLMLWASSVKRDIHAVYLASDDPRVPWLAKAIALLVAGYALSPIDLIPDFVPVLGYLDDLVLVPLGIYLVIRLIPPDIMAEHRQSAAAMRHRSANTTAALIIIIVWMLSFVLASWIFVIWISQMIK